MHQTSLKFGIGPSHCRKTCLDHETDRWSAEPLWRKANGAKAASPSHDQDTSRDNETAGLFLLTICWACPVKGGHFRQNRRDSSVGTPLAPSSANAHQDALQDPGGQSPRTRIPGEQ